MEKNQIIPSFLQGLKSEFESRIRDLELALEIIAVDENPHTTAFRKELQNLKSILQAGKKQKLETIFGESIDVAEANVEAKISLLELALNRLLQELKSEISFRDLKGEVNRKIATLPLEQRTSARKSLNRLFKESLDYNARQEEIKSISEYGKSQKLAKLKKTKKKSKVDLVYDRVLRKMMEEGK